MPEKILIMGPPGSGKTTAVIKTARYLNEFNKRIFIIDLEDKFERAIKSQGGVPPNMKIYTCMDWIEANNAADSIIDNDRIRPGEWLGIDRIDLSWPLVQRWYAEIKYKKELSEMLTRNAGMIKGGKKFVPRFDMGDWPVVNENYDNLLWKLISKTRANVIYTSGVKADEATVEMFGNLGVMPRGQKELGHQPDSVLLLKQAAIPIPHTGDPPKFEIIWTITTAKDLADRPYFRDEELLDFVVQYLGKYYNPKED